MSANSTPASKSDRRKSKRKSCLEIIASAKIVRDPDTTDPLKDEPDEEYDINALYADGKNAIKELEIEEQKWLETSRLCSDMILSESFDAVDIPDVKKVLFEKQENLCKEVFEHLEKVSRQKQIRQFVKSFEVTRASIHYKYEESNAKYEALQLQFQSK